MAGIHFTVTADTEQVVRGLQRTQEAMMKTASVIEREGMAFDDFFNKLKNVAAFSMAGFSVKELSNQIMSVRGQFQQLEIAFKTMLGSEKEAAALMEQLVRTAAITPFDLQGVANGAKQLLAYGVSANEVNETLTRLGDIAAGLSIPLGDLVYLYGTTITQGRMFTQDLRQFQGRGIPIAEELAKQFGVTKDKVGELVTAGRVGAEEFKKAIVSMTSEGSKFGGLMEAQSKTINGQISNIGDAIDSMFNDMGKQSEGIINGTLGVVSTLVENYDKVGKTLATIVAAYGTYKTAVMVVTAMQALQTAGVGALTASEAVHYSWLVLTEKAQALLNKTMLANPYVLAASLIGGTIAALYAFTGASDDAVKAQEKLNKAYDDFRSQAAAEQAEIDRLFEKLRKAKEGTTEYGDAKDKILKQYDKYLGGLSDEIRTLKDVEGAYKAVSKAARESALARAKESALADTQKDYGDTYAKQLGKIQDALTKAVGAEKTTSYLQNIQKELSQTGTISEKTEKAVRKLFRGSADYGNSESWFTTLRTNEASLKKKTKAVEDMFQMPTQKKEEQKKKNGDTKAELEEQKKAIQGELDALTAIEAAGKKGQEKRKKIAELNKKLEAYSPTYDTKQRKTGSKREYEVAQVTEGLKDLNKNQERERNRADEDMELRLTQNRIDLMEEGTKKILAQQELDFKKEQTQLDREREDAIRSEIERQKAVFDANENAKAAKNENYKKEVFSEKNVDNAPIESLQNKYDALQADLKQKQAKAVADYQKSEIQAMQEYLKQYGDYEQKRLAITKEYEEKIRNAKTEGEKLSLQKEQENALSNINFEQIKQSMNWEEIFSNLANYESQYLAHLREELRDALNVSDITAENARIITDKINEISALIEQKKNALGKLFGQGGIMSGSWLGSVFETKSNLSQLESKAQTDRQKADSANTAANVAKFNKQYLDSSLLNALKEKGYNFQNVSDEGVMGAAQSAGLIEQYNEAIQAGTKATEAATAASSASATAGSSAMAAMGSKAAGSFAIVDAIIHGVNDNLQSANKAVQEWGIGGKDFQEKFSTFAESSQYATDAFDSLKKGDIAGVVYNLGNAFSTLGESVGLWSNSNISDKIAEFNEMANALNVNTQALNKLTAKIGEGDAVNAFRNYEQAKEQMKANESITADMLYNLVKRYDGHHSTDYNFYDDYNGKNIISRINRILGTKFENLYDIFHGDATILNRLYDTEEGRQVLTDFTNALRLAEEDAEMTGNDIVGNFISMLNDYSSDAYDELHKSFQEAVTGISFDSFKDGFKSMLMDMDSDVDDFKDDFTKKLMQSVLNAHIEKLFGSQLSDLYDKWTNALDDNNLTQQEVEELQSVQDDLVAQMIAERDMLAKVTGYDTTTSQDQSAASKAADKVTYDQMDEFTGILRAIQIALEQHGNGSGDFYASILSSASISMSYLSNMVESFGYANNYLSDIYDALKAVKKDVAEIVGSAKEISNNTQNL